MGKNSVKKSKNTIDAKVVNNESTTEKSTPPVITGYQFGANGNFIGEYQFEKNLDKEAVHCPPCTALCAPPGNLSADEEAFFDGEQWQVRKLTLPWFPDVELSANEKAQNREVRHGD